MPAIGSCFLRGRPTAGKPRTRFAEIPRRANSIAGRERQGFVLGHQARGSSTTSLHCRGGLPRLSLCNRSAFATIGATATTVSTCNTVSPLNRWRRCYQLLLVAMVQDAQARLIFLA